MEIILKPVAIISNNRKDMSDDFWGDIVSEIELVDDIPSEALIGIEEFSHVEIIFNFNRVSKSVEFCRHPRGNSDWPMVGIFAQRGKDRPNKLGITVAELIRKEERKIYVRHLDAIDGTPVIDIKPVMKEFLIDPKKVLQPSWASEMLMNYWA